MKNDLTYRFDPEKNAKLIELRDVSFEEVIAVLERKTVLDVINHPNQARYPGQKIYVIELNEYAYLVPFVEERNSIFLKTIFPNRQATKKYLSK